VIYGGKPRRERSAICGAEEPEANFTPEQLYRDADRAMYRAKEEGRNRLESSSVVECDED